MWTGAPHLASEPEHEEGAEEDEARGREEEAEVEGTVVGRTLDHADLLPGHHKLLYSNNIDRPTKHSLPLATLTNLPSK